MAGKDGTTSLLELCNGLYEPANLVVEKQGIVALLERETSREKTLEKALKEARIKARKEAAKKDETNAPVPAELLEQVEKDFFNAVNVEG